MLTHSIKAINNYELYIIKLSIIKKLKQKTNHLGEKTLILAKKPRFISTLDVENSYFKQPVLDETYVNKILYTESTQKYVLFFMYLDFANITSSQFSRIHTHNRGFFLDEDMYPANPYLNIQKVYKKWVHFHSFLINLFYVHTCIFMYSTKLLKNEVLSFNWSYDLLPYSLFKQVSNYFFFKGSRYGEQPDIIYNNFLEERIEVAFISDLQYHVKSIFHLKNCGVFLLGPVPYGMSPWSLHYSIPVASNTLFTQYFFIKLLLHIRQMSESLVFLNQKSIWLSSELKKN